MTHMEEAQLQLSEIEVLESIYPNKNEVVINNHDDFMLMKQFVETDGASFPPTRKLNITMNLKAEKSDSILIVEIDLPIDYPLVSLPQIFVRCDRMTRNIQQQFNEDLKTYLSSIEVGETCLYQILQWAAEESEQYIATADINTASQVAEPPEPESCTFIRLWIYSHHIYNKEKRKSILEWAKELKLTGFSLPGKPGIVCVEGMQDKCEEYWQRLRRQTWKKISIVHREEIGSNEAEFDKNKKFSDAVAEKDFGVHGGRDYHMDLGKFFVFLTDHSCQDIFPLLFGVEGKIPDKT